MDALSLTWWPERATCGTADKAAPHNFLGSSGAPAHRASSSTDLPRATEHDSATQSRLSSRRSKGRPPSDFVPQAPIAKTRVASVIGAVCWFEAASTATNAQTLLCGSPEGPPFKAQAFSAHKLGRGSFAQRDGGAERQRRPGRLMGTGGSGIWSMSAATAASIAGLRSTEQGSAHLLVGAQSAR